MVGTKQTAAVRAEREEVVFQLSDWWKATVALEKELDYVHSDACARAAWDDLVGRLMLARSELLYRALMDCVRLWRTQRLRLPPSWGTLLDAYVATAWEEGLSLTDFAILVAFRLRQRLEAATCRG